MKVCPVCHESFEDALKFCDVDGTRLQRDGSVVQSQSRAWSFLGVGLLLGALGLSVASVTLLPKRTPPVIGSATQPATPSSTVSAKTTAVEPPSGSAVGADPGAEPEVVVTTGPPPDLKKKDKNRNLAPDGSDGSTLDPKAAAKAAAEADKASRDAELDRPTSAASKKPEPAPPIKTVSETREGGGSASSAQTGTDPAKEQKRPAANTKDSASQNSNKKKDEKKGGFFRVFKKIFGKD